MARTPIPVQILCSKRCAKSAEELSWILMILLWTILYINIPIELNWLAKPVSGLVNKINIVVQCPPTRSSMDDYCCGKDIYLHAAYRDASEFVTVEYDDIELADIVVDNPSKKMWYCSNVLKSNMLRHAVIGACNLSHRFSRTFHSSKHNSQSSI